MDKSTVDEEIWQVPTTGKRKNEEWSAIIDYLVKTLENYLQQKIEITDESIEASIVDDEAICCSIRSASSFGGILNITWEGRLGMELIEGKPSISASLFIFSNNRRLVVAGHEEGSYVELVYEQLENNKGNWCSLGWLEDIYGEFKYIDMSP